MREPPGETMLLGLGFFIIGFGVAWSGVVMHSTYALLGLLVSLGGVALGLSGLIRWLWGRFRRK